MGTALHSTKPLQNNILKVFAFRLQAEIVLVQHKILLKNLLKYSSNLLPYIPTTIYSTIA